jgi:DNA-binding protein HU-beta
MTKSEFAAAFAEKTGTTKTDAEKSVNAFIDIITSTLKSGDKISFVGFGTFETTNRDARTGRNPQTGADITIAAGTVPKFKPGKSLKDAVNV